MFIFVYRKTQNIMKTLLEIANEHGLQDSEELFEFIVMCYLNGRTKSLINVLSKLSKEQKETFVSEHLTQGGIEYHPQLINLCRA